MTVLEQPLSYIFSKLREFQLVSCGHIGSKGQAQKALLLIILQCHLSTWLGVAAAQISLKERICCGDYNKLTASSCSPTCAVGI